MNAQLWLKSVTSEEERDRAGAHVMRDSKIFEEVAPALRVEHVTAPRLANKAAITVSASTSSGIKFLFLLYLVVCRVTSRQKSNTSMPG